MKPIPNKTGAEKGMALLGSMMLLVAITMVSFFANRSLIFEQKTSASHYRSTIALEAAEAGLEWALANMNNPKRIDTSNTTSTTSSCQALASPASSDRLFRDIYLDPGNTGSFAGSFSTVQPGCMRTASGWTCRCPASGTPAFPSCTAATGCPAFNVQFVKIPNHNDMVEIVTTGCNSSPCSSADARATVRQVLKLQPSLATPPAASLTAGGSVSFGSNAITVTNTDPATNGITINAGGDIGGMINESTVTTVPGTPAAATLVGNDASLSGITGGQMFQTFFGQTKEQMKAAPSTLHLAGGSGVTQLEAAITSGARVIWVNGDMLLNSNAQFGTASRPIILIVEGAFKVSGSAQIYGLVYSAATTWDNTGGGNAKIIGAAIAEGNFTTTGTPDPTYNPQVLANLKNTTGLFGKVPGSWRDF